jgi:hypothetical protein
VLEHYLSTLLILLLLPCAIQDWRDHQVSNWLTIPAFIGGWVVALYLGRLPFVLVIFAGCYLAWAAHGMGAADGKVAVLVAAVAPVGIMLGGLLLGVTFLLLRLTGERGTHLPSILWLWLGALLHGLLQMSGQQPGGTLFTAILLTMPQTIGLVTAWLALLFLTSTLHHHIVPHGQPTP